MSEWEEAERVWQFIVRAGKTKGEECLIAAKKRWFEEGRNLWWEDGGD